MIKWLAHLQTVNRHRYLVMQHCFRVGLYWQGLTHDLSKYTPIEFLVGARYYQGDRSPNEMERKVKGYSAAWLHHKGRNKHHLEYWIDYSGREDQPLAGNEMPVAYVVEMFCDRMAASKTYRGAAYRNQDPYEYYARSKTHYLLHPHTARLLEQMLVCLRDKGEAAAFAYIRREILSKKQEKKRCCLPKRR